MDEFSSKLTTSIDSALDLISTQFTIPLQNTIAEAFDDRCFGFIVSLLDTRHIFRCVSELEQCNWIVAVREGIEKSWVSNPPACLPARPLSLPLLLPFFFDK
jgi:hypothetical protein